MKYISMFTTTYSFTSLLSYHPSYVLVTVLYIIYGDILYFPLSFPHKEILLWLYFILMDNGSYMGYLNHFWALSQPLKFGCNIDQGNLCHIKW